jgi:uroporphyrinogen-III synthase
VNSEAAVNIRVLVTRSAQQASALARTLAELGLDPITIPVIELTEPTSFAALDAAIASLASFDWLLFTSANAVHAFHRRAGTLPRTPRIAAIGAATAAALEAVGLRADLIPPQAVAESLAAALTPHARRSEGSPARMLLVRAEDARDALPDALRSAGAVLTLASAYRNAIPTGCVGAIRSLFASPADSPAAITFTSSSSARHLLALCEAAAVTLPPTALRISIGPVTSDTLRELGIPPHAEAPEANIRALAEATRDALTARR